jgi:4-hydroxyphenylpyruvate dioxygenase
MYIDYVHFYLEDARKWRNWFVNVMGFRGIASGCDRHTSTEVVSHLGNRETSSIIFVLSSPLSVGSPVAQFLQIESPANLKHTLIERQGKTPIVPTLNLTEIVDLRANQSFLNKIDHIVLNVASGELESTAHWYETVLGFQKKQSFRIQTEQSGLYSQVMVHPKSGVQIPINEPSSPNSQIQEFLEINRGSGIQHIALQTTQIIQLTAILKKAGLAFLKLPENYYEGKKNKASRAILTNLELENLIQQEILIDREINNPLDPCQLSPLLLQIFTQPIFEKPTFFFEFIERRDRAQGFGEGNFRALFEAIEREQLKRGKLIL